MRRWTDEDDRLIVRLWHERMPVRAMALELGASEGSLVGRIKRLRDKSVDLPPRDLPRVRRQGTEPRPDAAPATERLVRIANPIPLIALGAHDCKWPQGDPGDLGFGFCGERKAGPAYCAYHRRFAYQPQG